MAKLLYQGHGSMRLISEGGTVVYIDPFAGEGYDRPADLILVTRFNCPRMRITAALSRIWMRWGRTDIGAFWREISR